MNTNTRTIKTKYTFNEYFFKKPELWEQKQSYFLGWLASDGCSQSNGISIRLQESDKRILELLKQSIEYTGPLYYVKRSSVNDLIGNSNYQNRWGLTIYRKFLKNDLLDLGIDNNKSNNYSFPTFLKPDIIHHFLRGYYEGDGTISYSYVKETWGRRLLFEIHLICTPAFVPQLQQILKDINIESRVTMKADMKNGNVVVKFSGNLAALRFFNYAYKDADLLLRRKFRKFLRLINYMKRRMPFKGKSEVLLELNKAINLAKYLIKHAEY